MSDKNEEQGAAGEPEMERPASPEADVPEIEIRDPGVEDEPTGYQSGLLVPLVVVPAMIVMLGVLIVALFGLVSGEEASPKENLTALIEGGANEREQAAFGLVRQILDYQHARAEGREPEWNIGAEDLDSTKRALEAIPAPRAPEEVWVPFVLSSVLAQLGESVGVDRLVEMTALPDSLDPEFTFRTNAIFILGSIGRELDEGPRARVASALIGFLEGEDEGIAWLAAGALQNLPGQETVAALKGLLGRRRVDLRLQAALSLAELDDPAGADVLQDLVALAPYQEERESDPTRWAPQTISGSRQKVLRALADIGRLPADAELERLADEDDDPNVQALARELLSAGSNGPGGA